MIVYLHRLFRIGLLSTLIINALATPLKSYKYDLTLIGMISQESALKFPGTWIEFLKDTCSINFIPSGFVNLQDATPATIKIAQNPDHSAGRIALLLDNVIWNWEGDRTAFVPDSYLKIVYSMIESNKLIPQWVTLLNTKFDLIIVPDKYFVDVYKNSGVTTPLFILPCALPLQHLFEKPHDYSKKDFFTFTMSGAFWERKNQIKMLQAFAEEFGNNPKVKFKIHGRGGYQWILDELFRMKNQYNLDNVEISCSRLLNRDFELFMEKSDCYIIVSRAEGFSISPREAMALGIPCIVSENTGHITICETGLVRSVPSTIPVEPDQFEFIAGMVDRGNQFDCTVADIRAALRDVYDNYVIYTQKAIKAREWVKHYECSNLKAKYQTFIKPKKVVWGSENSVTDDGVLTTNSYDLYQKYLQILSN